jgi:hypothetical protein
MLNKWVTRGEVPLEDLTGPNKASENKKFCHDDPAVL